LHQKNEGCGWWQWVVYFIFPKLDALFRKRVPCLNYLGFAGWATLDKQQPTFYRQNMDPNFKNYIKIGAPNQRRPSWSM
jgi:hypothetical protein